MWNMCSKQAAEFAKGLSHTKRPRGPTREVMGASVHDTFSSRQSPYHHLNMKTCHWRKALTGCRFTLASLHRCWEERGRQSETSLSILAVAAVAAQQ